MFRTRGQPAAVAAVRAMLRTGPPHAILLSGPAGVGKTTLAGDIAAGLLCRAPEPADRPCGACRGCRLVASGNHPDVHRLAPTGAGSLIPIGGRDERGVRDLVAELALMPVEGGHRVAIVESAQRMTDDAQSAFLKTLEEPPARTTIVLCADGEDRLLPTVRSRCARVRLGPVGSRDVEAILGELGEADAPTAARLARLTDGRPGRAIEFARAREAVTIQGEIARVLLDQLDEDLTARLVGVRDLAGRAAALVRALDQGAARKGSVVPPGAGRVRAARAGRSTGAAAAAASAPGDLVPARDQPSEPGPATDADTPATDDRTRVPAAERRRAALVLLEVWRSVVRDLGLAVAGDRAAIRDLDLADDIGAAAPRLTLQAVGAALRRIDVAAERIEGNVSPELVLDGLAARWTNRERPAGGAGLRGPRGARGAATGAGAGTTR